MPPITAFPPILAATGRIAEAKFPNTIFDESNKEKITYNISACTGGFIYGKNGDTGKSWRADIAPGGAMRGRDVDGDPWRYDPTAHVYTNEKTGRTCSQSSIRLICPA